MSTIVDSDNVAMLIDHLKSPDFFDTERESFGVVGQISRTFHLRKPAADAAFICPPTRNARHLDVSRNKGQTDFSKMNYYRRYWDETTGDDLTDSWGTSTFFFETDSDNNVLRQLQVFENGKGLKYWDNFVRDDYGMLSDQPLHSDDFEQYRVDKAEFEHAWTIDYKK